MRTMTHSEWLQLPRLSMAEDAWFGRSNRNRAGYTPTGYRVAYAAKDGVQVLHRVYIKT